MAHTGIPTTNPRADEGAVSSILAALTTPAGQHDPYPHYARLHLLAPAAVGPDGALVVAGYQLCAAVLKDHRLQKFPARLLTASGYPDWQQHPALKLMFTSMLMINPPEHTGFVGRSRPLSPLGGWRRCARRSPGSPKNCATDLTVPSISSSGSPFRCR